MDNMECLNVCTQMRKAVACGAVVLWTSNGEIFATMQATQETMLLGKNSRKWDFESGATNEP